MISGDPVARRSPSRSAPRSAERGLGRTARLAANADPAGVFRPVEERCGPARGPLTQRDSAGQHKPRHVAKRCQSLATDRVPADVFELVARRRLTKDIAAIAKKKSGVEATDLVGRRDRSADIGENIHRRYQASLEIGALDRRRRR